MANTFCLWVARHGSLVLAALALAACGTQGLYLAPPASDPPPAIRTFLPDDGKRHPLVVLVPGCEAPLLSSRAAFYPRRAAALEAAGFAVAIVTYPGAALGDPSCRSTGTPAENAAAIRAAVAGLRSQPGIDAGHIHLVGWSRGGRAVLDIVAAPARLPGLVSAAVFYPPCPAAKPWASAVTLQLFLGQTDTVDPAADCAAWADKTDGPGPVVVTRYAGVGHGFDIDEAGNAVFDRYRTGTPLVYDASTAYQSRADLLRFLQLTLPASP